MSNVHASTDWRETYRRDGFLSPVPILSQAEAAEFRSDLERAEADHGTLHYLPKIHTIYEPAARLATDKRVLDVVETVLGPDILLFDVTYIIKEPRSSSHVSWHQDLTYWGFSGDEQVSMWLALSPATDVSGCMRMVPGSHANGRLDHQDNADESNVLHRGQTVAGVAEEQAVFCPLQPGEASFHHGWTLHASMPNHSDDRRIGLNVQFISPAMRQLINPHETATLVRGNDPYGHFTADAFATGQFEPGAVARHAELERIRKDVWDKAS